MLYREYRYPCDLPVTLSRPDRAELPATIVNISTWGARLARLEGLQRGDTLRFSLGAGCPLVTGHVQWSRGSYCGVRFDLPLEPRQIAMARKSAGHRQRVPPAGWNLQLQELR